MLDTKYMPIAPLKQFVHAILATDIVIFTIQNGQLKVLLIKMTRQPYVNMWAIPGGLITPDESADEAALRHLRAKTNVKDVYLEQLYTFGRVDRDPRGRVVSVAYFALIPSTNVSLKTTADYAGIDWFPIKKLPSLAYDHSEIISRAIDRLKSKLAYSTISYSLLSKEFTLSELQSVYEVILGRKLDKRNFRKKILSLGLIRATGKKRRGTANRPAELYTFKKRIPEFVDIL
ncbi:MAG: NUDIX domain-containing protein [Patescibacteria group bacterium]